MDKSTDRIVTRFDYARLVKQTTIPIITVYAHPADYPDKYVARVWDVNRPTSLAAIADTYEELLQAIPTNQMTRMEPSPKDDPVIRETWI
ncbi:MAG: hypothetical protein IJF88_05630 [Oscillospiraceae bacterium]|nr:hypothetical protein [Oscillospiraceae bacterium]